MPLVLNKNLVTGESLRLSFFTTPKLVKSLVKNINGNNPGNTATINKFKPCIMLELYFPGLTTKITTIAKTIADKR